MKIQTFFLSIVALVLISFSAFHIHHHSILEEKKYIHFFVLSQNDDFFLLKVGKTYFTSFQAEQGDLGMYSYVGKIPRKKQPLKITFKAGSVDTTFHLFDSSKDSIFVGMRNDGSFLLQSR